MRTGRHPPAATVITPLATSKLPGSSPLIRSWPVSGPASHPELPRSAVVAQPLAHAATGLRRRRLSGPGLRGGVSSRAVGAGRLPAVHHGLRADGKRQDLVHARRGPAAEQRHRLPRLRADLRRGAGGHGGHHGGRGDLQRDRQGPAGRQRRSDRPPSRGRDCQGAHGPGRRQSP